MTFDETRCLSWRVDHNREKGTTETRWCYQPKHFHLSQTEASADIPVRRPDPVSPSQRMEMAPLESHRGRRRHLLAMGQRLCRSKWFGHLSPKGAAQRQGLRHKEWQERNGLVLYRGRVYVPPDGQLRHDLVNALHDSPITSHSGQWKTTDLVARNFWWRDGPLHSQIYKGLWSV